MSWNIGLTGGIGCGKSTVAKLFEKYGPGIVDTDFISHQLTKAGGKAIPAIREQFGEALIAEDGSLNRPAMRNLIFSDLQAKMKLEAIMHPMILDQVLTELGQQKSKPYNIIIVPLLPERPEFQKLVQRILVVECSEEKQIERVINRNSMTESEVRAIISRQTPKAERLLLADDVISNEGSLEDLANHVAILHAHYSK